MDTMTGQSDRQDALNSPEPDMPDGGGDGDAMKTVLDMSVPEIADAFQSAEIGDTFKITGKDDNEVTLEKQAAAGQGDEMPDKGPEAEPDEGAEEAGMPKSNNPSITMLIARKNKR